MKRVVLLSVMCCSISLVASACKQSRLPAAMPAGVVITFTSGGGMTPARCKVTVSAGKAVVSKTAYSNEKQDYATSEYTLPVSSGAMDSLYQAFVTDQFDLIKNEPRKSIVYDAPSEMIAITAEQFSYSVTYGGNSPLSAANQKRYADIAQRILGLDKRFQQPD